MLSYWERKHFINYDYLIVGAGIVGLSTALSLRERDPKASILLLERDIFPAGASTKNAGFACFGSLSELLEDVERMGETAAMQLVKERWEGLQLLRRRVGDQALGYQHYGGYELLPATKLGLLERLEDMNQLLQPLFHKPVFVNQPELRDTFGFPKDRVATLISNPFEGQVDTGAMMHRLITLVRTQNISMLTGAEVSEFYKTDQVVQVAVRRPNKQMVTFTGKRLALCTNAFTSHLLPELELDPGRGLVLITKPLNNLKFKGVFHFDQGYYYFRNVGNRVLFGGGRNLDMSGEQTTEFGTNEYIREELQRQLSALILPDTPFDIDQYWSGIMAFGPDKRPLIGRQDPLIGYAVRLGGMGVALGSVLGDQLASLLYLRS